MKKILIIFFAAVGIVTVQADPTPTNSIRMQDLTNAVTPLDGTELVPIVQNFGTRKTTVADFNYPAKTLAMAASNTLSLRMLINAAAAAGSYVSNFNANAATSNTLAATRASLGALAYSNNILLANVLDAGSMAAQATNNYYPAGNPNNYQSGAQVAVFTATAIAQSFSGSLAGSFLVSNLNYAVFSNAPMPALVLPQQINYWLLDMSKSSVQKLVITNQGVDIAIVFTNLQAGQNVEAFLVNNSDTLHHVMLPDGILNYAGTLYTNANGAYLSSSIQMNKTALLSFTVFGGSITNIIFSMTVEK